MRQLSGCEDVQTCPRIYEDDDVIVVQGVLVEDPTVTGRTNPGEGEAVVAVPRGVFLEAVRRLATA